MTETKSEDRTRNYPTHSQKIAVSHQKKKILGEGWPRERKMSTETQPYFNKTRGELTTKLTRLHKLHVRRVCTEVTLKCVLNKKLQDERENTDTHAHTSTTQII